MTTIVVKDGRNVPSLDMAFDRINLVANGATPIPVASEFLRIRSASGNGVILVYVGEADVAIDDNGYELSAGDSLSVSGGLGQVIAANTIYVIADADCIIFYMAHN